MFKFGGWRASLNFSGPNRRKEVYENGPELSVGGAYRTQREEFFGRNSLRGPAKILTPSMVKLPPSNEKLKTSKSANNISDPHNLAPQLRKSAHDVSTDPRGGTSSDRNSTVLHKNAKQSTKEKKNEKEQKSAERKQKKQEKLAMQEQAKKDKLRIQQEKKLAQQQAKEAKSKGEKKAAPGLPQASVAKTLVPPAPVPPPQPPQPAVRANPMAYSTNTLDSSISKTSGPPPYSERQDKQPNKRDNTGNTSFSKPIESSSWDMISEHRNQISRNPVASGSSSKQMVMDLQFSFDKAQPVDGNNSEV